MGGFRREIASIYVSDEHVEMTLGDDNQWHREDGDWDDSQGEEDEDKGEEFPN